MPVDRKKLDALLKWYIQEVGKDLIAVLVVNRDGLVIDAISGSSDKTVDEEIVGGVSALVEPVLTRITKEFSSGAFGTGTFDSRKNLARVLLEPVLLIPRITGSFFAKQVQRLFL